MKIYLFCPESGVYQGEDFADKALVRGRQTLPAGATAIAPPPYEPQQVPVFLVRETRWEVRPFSSMRGAEAVSGIPEEMSDPSPQSEVI